MHQLPRSYLGFFPASIQCFRSRTFNVSEYLFLTQLWTHCCEAMLAQSPVELRAHLVGRAFSSGSPQLVVAFFFLDFVGAV